MEAVRTITFAEALGRLQELLDHEVRNPIIIRSTLGGCTLQGPVVMQIAKCSAFPALKVSIA
jgi:hypothetical protein